MNKEFGIDNEYTYNYEIKKSKFICHIKPIISIDDAKKYILEIKNKHKDASHNCSAYIYNGIEHANDDGEPSKTAGCPMLNVLKKNNLNCIVVVVTRYFGGIKLGSGGLIRAYSNAVINAIDNIILYEQILGYSFEIKITHSEYSKVKHIINTYNLNNYNEKFDDKITINIIISNDQFELLKKELTNFNYKIEISKLKLVKVTKI